MQHRVSDLHREFRSHCDLDGFLGALLDPFARSQLDRMARIYSQAHSSNKISTARGSIPKIIHQIWIGPKPIPAQYKTFMEGWRRQYPEWEHRLWTDSEVAGLKLKSADLIAGNTCLGQKTDLLRVEILDQFGGLYVDTDYESLKSLNEVHETYDFYGTLRALPLLYLASPKLYPGPLIVCNSMIGSRPGHPILSAYLGKVRDIAAHPEYFKLSLLESYNAARLKFSKAQVQRIKETTIKTYIPFHHAVLDQLENGSDRNIIFPPTYFNPIDTWHSMRFLLSNYWIKRTQYYLSRKTKVRRLYQHALPETFAIHHSKASWVST